MFDLKDLMSRVNLPQDITRRGFLQVATVTAVFAAMNQARAQTGAQPYIILETPKGLIVGDPSLCVDCQRCEMACTEFNDGKNDPVLAPQYLVRSGQSGRSSLAGRLGRQHRLSRHVPPVRSPGPLRQCLPAGGHPRRSQDRRPLCG